LPEIKDHEQFIQWFRHSSPYINTHRGKTFVILFDGKVINSDLFPEIIHDFALLNSLGIKLVLIFDACKNIDSALEAANIKTQKINDLRITSINALEIIKQTIGSIKLKIEAMLSMGVINSPMSGALLNVVSGNFITAKPIGVQNGTDFLYTGEVRRVDSQNICKQLDSGAIVLLPAIGYSPSGEIFNLTAQDVTKKTATSIAADKVIYMTEFGPLKNEKNEMVHQITLAEAKDLSKNSNGKNHPVLITATEVCHSGIKRVHLIDVNQKGALLLELFSRNGVGTLISQESYDAIRNATIEDVGGILELIEPLESQGILVKRSREKLEAEIHHFTVMERDGMIIACAALYPNKSYKTAELACLAVHPNYQNESRGSELLDILESQAKQTKMNSLFILTTKSEHWFVERGFTKSVLSELPDEKKKFYNYQRGSKAFIKTMD